MSSFEQERHSEEPHATSSDPTREKKRSSTSRNPLQAALREFLTRYLSSRPEYRENAASLMTDISASIPKRYMTYAPLLLLPSHFINVTARKSSSSSSVPTTPAPGTRSSSWNELSGQLSTTDLQNLWECIIAAFAKDEITHIAIGAPIEMEIPGLAQIGDINSTNGRDNVMRSPTGIVSAYGDFGLTPASPGAQRASINACGSIQDDAVSDYNAALWVQCIQNGGIFQVWAPMWTMFSRGNIKEKARILSGTPSTQQTAMAIVSTTPSMSTPTFSGLDGPDGELTQNLSDVAVVDMYVGIGYFAFSYLKRGVGRVFGWELNGWSVEGLRRGAKKNGWKCEIVRLSDFDDYIAQSNDIIGISTFSASLKKRLQSLYYALQDPEIRLVVFHGDNRWAQPITQELEQLAKLSIQGKGQEDDGEPVQQPVPQWQEIRHINLGLLPTSRQAWEIAEEVISQKYGGWIHIHENVEIKKIDEKVREVESWFAMLVRRRRLKCDRGWYAKCVHVERVKTYAPGIMHCVFDVRVRLV